MKSVPLSKIETWNAHELLAEELFCLQNLSHPNIVRFFEAFQDYKYIHIVTECLLGGDLLTHIERNNVFNEKIAAKLLKDVFSVVNFLHKKNICHRDIKAENLMFDETLESVKVIDFGLATLFKNEKERKFSFLVGSPFYIAPEILKGECTGMGCDVWSLGVLTYVILIGKPPFYEQETNKLWEEIINGKLDFIKEISNEAKDLIKEMMNKEKYERISIEKAVNHQWFEKNIEKKKDSIIFLEGIKGSIRKCCLYMLKRKKRKHKNKIHQIFENILMNFLKNTTWKIMEQLFYFIDYDKTGMINQIKIVEFLDKCGFDFNKNDKEIISNFILNENNSVEFYDFSCAIMEGDFKFNFDVFPQVLKHADIDECGGFSIKDFRYALKRRGYNMEVIFKKN